MDSSHGVSSSQNKHGDSAGTARRSRLPSWLPSKIFLNRLFVALTALAVEILVWSGRNDYVYTGRLPVWLVLAIVVAGYCTLVNTRSPIPGYLTMIALSVLCLIVPGTPTMMVGFLVTLFYMARLLPRRQAYLALPGSIIPLISTSITSADRQIAADVFRWLLSLCVTGLFILAVWGSGVALARYEHTLRTERVWATHAREEATAMERLRISRDLHDSVAHALTGIVLQTAGLRAVQRTNSREIDLDAALADIQETAEQSIRELHRLLGLLRSEVDDSDSPPRGIDDLAELTEAARASGFETSETVSGTVSPLDPSVSHAAYRVVQESLSNVMRHAGQGAKAYVETHWEARTVTITVRSISGIVEKTGLSGGFGLLGLRERVTICGGTLVSGPTDTGFLVKAVLPVRTELGSMHHHSTEDS